MRKHNIDQDLLKILKSKREEELFYTIMNMGNGTYQYEIEYLNKVPRKLIQLYLKKIILVANPKRKLRNFEDYMDSILVFCQNINNIDDKNLNRDKLLSLEVYLKARKIKTQAEELKENAVKTSSFFLATIIFLSLAMPKKESEALETEPEASISSSTLDETKEELNYLEVIPPKANEFNDLETSPTEEIEEPDSTEPIFDAEESKDREEIEIDINITNEEKAKYILEYFNLTQEEFDVVAAIAMAEAKYNSYDDTYYVINTIYNRTISKKWNRWVNSWRGDNEGTAGKSLYIQATQGGQFVVYENGRYNIYLGVKEGPAYQAVIDFLYTLEIKHNFLSFKSASTVVEGSTQLVEDGNNYYDVLTEEDRIEQELSR